MKLRDITPSWFFTEAPLPLKLLQIYVRGDAIILLPFIIMLLFVGFFSLQWMGILFSLFFAFRFLGEMIFWLLQQFGDRKYRPFDYGFKNLDNNAIYVIYQLKALVGLVLSTGVVLILLTAFI